MNDKLAFVENAERPEARTLNASSRCVFVFVTSSAVNIWPLITTIDAESASLRARRDVHGFEKIRWAIPSEVADRAHRAGEYDGLVSRRATARRDTPISSSVSVPCVTTTPGHFGPRQMLARSGCGDAHIRSTVMCGPGYGPHSSVSTPVIASMPRVASRISLDGERRLRHRRPPGSLRIAIVPPVKRITITGTDSLQGSTRQDQHRQAQG